MTSKQQIFIITLATALFFTTALFSKPANAVIGTNNNVIWGTVYFQPHIGASAKFPLDAKVATGDDAASAKVKLFKNNNGTWDLVATYITGKDGSYDIHNVKDGEYRVQAVATLLDTTIPQKYNPIAIKYFSEKDPHANPDSIIVDSPGNLIFDNDLGMLAYNQDLTIFKSLAKINVQAYKGENPPKKWEPSPRQNLWLHRHGKTAPQNIANLIPGGNSPAITSDDYELVGECVTGDDGQCSFNTLGAGYYTVGADGYDSTQDVTIPDNGDDEQYIANATIYLTPSYTTNSIVINPPLEGPYTQGSSQTVNFTANGLDVLIAFLVPSNGSQDLIASNIPAQSGSFTWTVDAPPGTYQLLITNPSSCSSAAATPTGRASLIAQIKAQIQVLLQQITVLRAQQGATAPATTWCHTFNTYLVAGSTNGDVSYLQTALTKQGFNVSGDSQGIFGNGTAAAVVSFQKKYGIRQTGTVGPITRAKLNSLYGCASANSISALAGSNACVPTVQALSNPFSIISALPAVNDTAIKSEMSQLPAAATQAFTNCGSYGGCGGAPANPLYVAVDSFEGILPAGSIGTGTPEGNAAITSNAWCVWSTLYSKDASGNDTYWCTDSTGYVGAIDTAGSIYSCGAGHQFTCQSSAALCQTIDPTADGYCDGTCASSNGPCIPSTNQPSITVTSPNGGESWQVGETHNIKWTTQSYSANQPVDIQLCGASTIDNRYVCQGIVSGILNTGTYSWTIPSQFPIKIGAGNVYKIMGLIYPLGLDHESLSDLSDNSFTITAGSYCIKDLDCPVGNKCVSNQCVPPPSITLTSPNGGETWTQGQTYNIKWISTRVDGNVNINLTPNNGSTQIPITSVSASSGSYLWIVPSSVQPGTTYKIIIGSGSAYDYSDNAFSVVATAAQPSITVTSPIEGDTWQAINDVNIIKWTYGGISGNSSASIEIVDQNNKTVCDVSEGYIPLSNNQWTISHDYLSVPGCVGNNRRVQIIFHGNQTTTPNYDVTGYSGYFNIVTSGSYCIKDLDCPVANKCVNNQCVPQPSITVTSPNGGETWTKGSTQNITWTSAGVSGNVNINLTPDNGSTQIPITSVSASSGSYLWIVPSSVQPGTTYKIIIGSGSAYDYSDNTFSIASPAGFNALQSNLASISAAIQRIAQEIQSLLKK